MQCRVAILLSVLGSGLLMADDSVTARSGEPVAFMVIDSDRNGYVSRVEARSVSVVESGFDVADINQDGLLDKDEYVELGNARISR